MGHGQLLSVNPWQTHHNSQLYLESAQELESHLGATQFSVHPSNTGAAFIDCGISIAEMLDQLQQRSQEAAGISAQQAHAIAQLISTISADDDSHAQAFGAFGQAVK